jgi:hypothetical protein
MRTIANASPVVVATSPVSKPQLSPEVQAMMAEIARLKAENEALTKSKPESKPSIRVTDKGGISVYGIGRFPVTLYRKQWVKLLALADEIRAVIEANTARLDASEAAHAATKAAAKPQAPTTAQQ